MKMESKKIDLERISNEFHEFSRQFQTMLLATASREGVPEASYAPFIRDKSSFYVYVSELSQHTSNLLENPQAGVLFIENESESKNLFARRRISYRCMCEEVERGSLGYEQLLDSFENKFGNMIAMLRSLGDFHLYQISPLSGSYVSGFGKAFNLSGENLDQVEHLSEAKVRENQSQRICPR